MGKITIVEPKECVPVRASDKMTPEQQSRFSPGELNSVMRRYLPREGSTLEMFEVAFQPNEGAQPHAHDKDQIIYVLKGELRVGARVLPAGSALNVEERTVYSFRAGPEGCTILNFRATGGTQYFTRAEIVEEMHAGQSAE